MPDAMIDIDVAAWVERARSDPVAFLQRQAIEVALNAIAMTAPLKEKLVLKGGILMGLAYDSPRNTGDIDLTAALQPDASIDKRLTEQLDNAFPRAAANLGYARLLLKIQSVKREPRKLFPEGKYPALKMKVAFAQRDTKQAEALANGKAVQVIEVDLSFNEPLNHVQVLQLTGGHELLAYGLADLIAEKYRAMMQQVIRNRERRQDVYDLWRLVADPALQDVQPDDVIQAIREKCRARDIEPSATSLDDPEVRRRSGANWATMELEIGELPDFDECYELVNDYYRRLPW